jgi:hypothetical protein
MLFADTKIQKAEESFAYVGALLCEGRLWTFNAFSSKYCINYTQSQKHETEHPPQTKHTNK